MRTTTKAPLPAEAAMAIDRKEARGTITISPPPVPTMLQLVIGWFNERKKKAAGVSTTNNNKDLP